MAFPKKFGELAARLRVPAGFVVAALFLWFARPTPLSLAIGAAAAAPGLALRAWAAGHLRKNQELATSGPYAHVRNPLYVGSLLAGLGCAIAGGSWAVGAAVACFFVFFYLPVVDEEERHLAKILPDYEQYRRRAPKLFPSLKPLYSGGPAFSAELYRRNREYQALLAFLAVLGALAVKLLMGPGG